MQKLDERRLEHLYVPHSEHTLCGVVEDELDWDDINKNKDDPRHTRENTERVARYNESFQAKREFTSNCKRCVSALRELRTIKR